MPASSTRWTALMVAALAARVLLVHFGWHAPLASRIELSSPVDSLARLREGAALVEMGLSPYEGSMLHVPPLVLLLFTPFLYVADALGASEAPYASIVRSAPFVALDALVAAALFAVAARVAAASNGGDEQKTKENGSATSFSDTSGPAFAACAYLLNPMSVAACAAGSTSALGTSCVALALAAACKEKPEPIVAGACLATLAFVTSDARVPTLLLYPVASLARDGAAGDADAPRNSETKNSNRRFRATFGGFFAACLVLGAVSTQAYLDVGVTLEQWTNATYAFTFLVTDLTPNLGVHWYLFAELFSHFRWFFLFVFHAFPAFLSVPVLARYGHTRPILAVGVVLALHTVLGPYPTWGNVAGYLAFAPIFTHGEQAAGARMTRTKAKTTPRVGFAVSAALAVTATLTPIFWHLWIEARVVNANFLFAVTLAHFAAQSALIVSWIGAAVERDAASSARRSRQREEKEKNAAIGSIARDGPPYRDSGRGGEVQPRVATDAPASGLARRKR
jgi:phosphatidylinositol glycan class U